MCVFAIGRRRERGEERIEREKRRRREVERRWESRHTSTETTDQPTEFDQLKCFKVTNQREFAGNAALNQQNRKF